MTEYSLKKKTLFSNPEFLAKGDKPGFTSIHSITGTVTHSSYVTD
jgi:hypothetical protein